MSHKHIVDDAKRFAGDAARPPNAMADWLKFENTALWLAAGAVIQSRAAYILNHWPTNTDPWVRSHLDRKKTGRKASQHVRFLFLLLFDEGF